MSRTFIARKYAPGSGDPQLVKIIVGKGLIRIAESDESLRLDDVEVQLGGYDEDRIKIYDSQTGVTLFCEDRALLDSLYYSEGHRKVIGQAQTVRQKVKLLPLLKRTYWIRIGAILAAVTASVYMTIDRVADLAAERINPAFEQGIGKSYARSHKLNSKSAAAQRVGRIGKKLVAQVKNNPYYFHFYVQDDPDVNAFAAPGGYIVVNSGLIERATSDDELAGVIGHEIGHVLHRDSLRYILHNAGLSACLGICAGLGGGQAEQIGQALSTAHKLEDQSFGRAQEARADITGVDLAVQANYKGEALIGFFERLEKEDLSPDNKLTALLSNHPMNSERIASVNAELARLKREQKEKSVNNNAAP